MVVSSMVPSVPGTATVRRARPEGSLQLVRKEGGREGGERGEGKREEFVLCYFYSSARRDMR